MNSMTKILSLTLASSLLLTACSKKEEITEADVEAAASKAAQEAAAASDKKTDDKLAAMASDAESKLAASKADAEAKLASAKADADAKLAAAKADSEAKLNEAKAEMEAKLAAETKALKEQFQSSNAALKSQFESLKEKYESIKDKLPEDTVAQISAKLPELASSLGGLESIANKFSPGSLDQLKELQSKYETELGVAKKVADEILKLLGKGSLESMMPKL